MSTNNKKINMNNIIDSDPISNSLDFKLPIKILLSIKRSSALGASIHPQDLINVFKKSKSLISRACKLLTDNELITKKYDYKIGSNENYLTLKITEAGIQAAERLLQIGLTPDEWSMIANQSPLEKPALIKSRSEPKAKCVSEPVLPVPAPSPFKSLKKDPLLNRIIEFIKRDVNSNLIDNYETAARDETVAAIIDETMDIFQNNLFNIFEGLDIIKFTK